MSAYSNTALAFGDLKNAALYFDHVIPVNLSLSFIPTGMRLYSLEEVPPTAQAELEHVMDEIAVRSLLAPDLRGSQDFMDELVQVNLATGSWMIQLVLNQLAKEHDFSPSCSDEKMESLARNAANKFYSFVRHRKYWDLLFDNGESIVGDDQETEPELVLSLPSLQLIDTDGCSWQQLHEFRRDEEARDKLRRLRLFAYSNYAGRSKAYVEDDIQAKIGDYNDAVKAWGFQTAEGAINMALTSKALHSALAGTFVASLCGAPTIAAMSAAIGGTIELGRVAIEVSKRRLALRRLMKENPVSYISFARDKLETPPNE